MQEQIETFKIEPNLWAISTRLDITIQSLVTFRIAATKLYTLATADGSITSLSKCKQEIDDTIDSIKKKLNDIVPMIQKVRDSDGDIDLLTQFVLVKIDEIDALLGILWNTNDKVLRYGSNLITKLREFASSAKSFWSRSVQPVLNLITTGITATTAIFIVGTYGTNLICFPKETLLKTGEKLVIGGAISGVGAFVLAALEPVLNLVSEKFSLFIKECWKFIVALHRVDRLIDVLEFIGGKLDKIQSTITECQHSINTVRRSCSEELRELAKSNNENRVKFCDFLQNEVLAVLGKLDDLQADNDFFGASILLKYGKSQSVPSNSIEYKALQ